MSFQANVLRVMIASPGDVPEARKAVTEEIYRRNYADVFLKRAPRDPEPTRHREANSKTSR